MGGGLGMLGITVGAGVLFLSLITSGTGPEAKRGGELCVGHFVVLFLWFLGFLGVLISGGFEGLNEIGVEYPRF